jgi:hypothetical protein
MRNTSLTDHPSDRARLQGLPQRASDPGRTLLEARAMSNLYESGPGSEPAAATRGASGSCSGRLRLRVAGLAP